MENVGFKDEGAYLLYLDSTLFDLRNCEYYSGISQNHRLADTPRDHLVHPPAQAGSTKAGCAGPHPDGFWISSGTKNPQHLRATCANARSPSQ